MLCVSNCCLIPPACGQRPKGVHIVTGVRDEQPNTLTWILDTAEEKSFELRASSMGEKTRFMERMRRAADVQKRRRSLQPAGRPRTDLDEKLNSALELGTNGYIGQALAALIELEDAHKENPEILYHLGTCRLVEGRELLAIEILVTAAALSESTNTPLYCDVMNNIGLAHFILGNYTAAKNCIRSALVHRPKDENIISNLASVHIECKDYAGAEALLKEVIKASAPCENTMLNWAEILNATERVSAAIDTLKRLVSVHPTCHPAYFMMGELYEKEGLAALAICAYEAACSLQDHRINYHDALRRVRLHVADDESVSAGVHRGKGDA